MRSLRRLRAEPPVLQRSCCVYEGLASDEVQNRAFCNLADEKLFFRTAELISEQVRRDPESLS